MKYLSSKFKRISRKSFLGSKELFVPIKSRIFAKIKYKSVIIK